jgi:hypothetical protein
MAIAPQQGLVGGDDHEAVLQWVATVVSARRATSGRRASSGSLWAGLLEAPRLAGNRVGSGVDVHRKDPLGSCSMWPLAVVAMAER